MAGQTDRTARLMLRIEASKQDAAAARKALESVRADFVAIEKATMTATKAQVQMSKSLQGIAREKALDKIAADFRVTEGLARSTSKALELTAAKLAAIGASEQEINRVTQAIARMNEAQGRGGRNQQGRLGEIGTQIRGLPAIQIAGGVSTDAVGNILRVSDRIFTKMGGDIGKLGAAAGITGAAVVAVALAMEQFNKVVQEAKDRLAGAIAAQNNYYEALASKTSEQVAQEVEELKRRRATLEAQAAEAQRALDESFASSQQLFGGDLTARIIGATGAYTDLEEQVTKTKKALEENIQTTTRYEQGLAAGAFATNDAAAAEERLAKARTDAAILMAREAGDTIRQQFRNMQMTSQQATDRVEEINKERAAIQASITSLRASGETSEQAAAALAEYEKQLQKLNAEQDNLLLLLPTVIARREAENAALEESAKQREETITAIKKYNADVEKIEQQTAEKRAALQDKYNDTLIQIAERAADAAENALQKLQERRTELQTDLVRGEASEQRKAQQEALQRQIDYQRDDAKAAREHHRDLLKIRRDAQQREQELIDARDFAGLFDQRRQTTEALQDSQRQYQEDRAERLLAFRQENEDKAAQFIFDREQRLIQYGQALQDAAQQYQRERAQIEAQRRDALNKAAVSYRDDLALLQSKYQNELALRRGAIQAELQLISQGVQARMQIEAQAQAALLNQARALLAGASGSARSAGSGGALLSRARGGSLMAGQSALVNDAFRGQRESFNGFKLPPGLGIFTPLQSGNVSPGRGAVTANVSFNIQSGNSPAQNQALVKEIRRTVLDVMEQVTA